MEISEVRVRLIPNRNNEDRLRAFCSITFDGEFVIRDLKLIEGINGIFVAMPSRKLADHCNRCGAKNHLRARFCNECGSKLTRNRPRREGDSRPKYHADVAHPINSQCRERIEASVRKAYEEELERSKQPGYKPVAYDDDEYGGSDYDDLIADLKKDAQKRRDITSSPQMEESSDSAPTDEHETDDKIVGWDDLHSAPEEKPRTSGRDDRDSDSDFGKGIL